MLRDKRLYAGNLILYSLLRGCTMTQFSDFGKQLHQLTVDLFLLRLCPAFRVLLIFLICLGVTPTLADFLLILFDFLFVKCFKIHSLHSFFLQHARKRDKLLCMRKL